MTSNVMFTAMVLKGLSPTLENIATILNFGPRKDNEEVKQDLINFANTRAEPGTDVASSSFYSSGGNIRRKITSFKCQKERSHGEGLHVKGKQGALQVQYEGPSCKGLHEREGTVQWHQPGPRKARLLKFREL